MDTLMNTKVFFRSIGQFVEVTICSGFNPTPAAQRWIEQIKSYYLGSLQSASIGKIVGSPTTGQGQVRFDVEKNSKIMTICTLYQIVISYLFSGRQEFLGYPISP
jgi:hypothetical protein